MSVFFPYAIAGYYNLDRTLLRELADTEMARGLITLLVAVSTVGIAITLIVYIATSSSEINLFKERFAFGKEVLTLLIGILGTIIGFYFGASQDQTHSHIDQTHGLGTPTTLALTNLSINPSTPVPGTKVILHATLSGDQPSYSYVITFKPDTMKEIHGLSPDGTISQEIKLDAYDPAKPLDITLEGIDPTGAFIGKPLRLAATP